MEPIILLFPAHNEVISFATQEQIDFLHDEKRNVPHELVLEPRVVDLTIQKTIEFRWSPAGSDGVVEIATDPSFSSYESFPGTNGAARVYNLQYGKNYFCRVLVDGEYSPVVPFAVKIDMPRWIYLPNITNVRDIGLWKTKSGKRIKQGMVYRGAQFEKWTSLPDKSPILIEGHRIFKEQLKIHTELDLRGLTEGTSTAFFPTIKNNICINFLIYLRMPIPIRSIFIALAVATGPEQLHSFWKRCWDWMKTA